MVETHDHFTQRLNHLGRKHEQMTHGYTTKVGRDGLITVIPKRRRVRGTSPLALIALLAIGFFCFKAFMLSAIGPVTYDERLAKLENGTIVEQVGAKVMGIDPVTGLISQTVGPILRSQ